jgi:hypothetical protein
VQLRVVFLQPAIAELDVPELLLDHPERIFDLGPNAALTCCRSTSASFGSFPSSWRRGYLLWAALTMKWTFDIKPQDIYWCTADIGWITGHTYICYGPCAVGATQVMFEGVPTYPNAGRFWEMIERHRVSIFYTAPTAIRSLIKAAEADDSVHPRNFDLSTLRLLGTVGEPINPSAWEWFAKHVGGGRCPVPRGDRAVLALGLNAAKLAYPISRTIHQPFLFVAVVAGLRHMSPSAAPAANVPWRSSIMNAKTSNPAALGLAAFALTTWLLSMINAGWFSGDSMGMVLAVALAYGGTAQALAGLMEIPRGNTFGATAFLSYGAFWWSLALFRAVPARQGAEVVRRLVPVPVGRVYALHVGRDVSLATRAAVGVPGVVDHLLCARRQRMDRPRMAASRRRLRRARDRAACVLSVGGRNHQRYARPQRAAGGRRRQEGACRPSRRQYEKRRSFD